MTDLPPGWEWAKLEDVAEVRLGRQRSPKNHSGTHMRPYLRAANVGWDGLKLVDVKQMNFTDAEADIHRLAVDDIVVVEASGSPEEVGKPAIWRGEIEDCCLQNTLIRVRSTGADPRYLLHFLDGEARRGAFNSRSRGVGINHLSSSRLRAWSVPIPPLGEQRRIVGELEVGISHIQKGDTTLATVASRIGHLWNSTLGVVQEEGAEAGSRVLLGDVCEVRAGIQKQPKRRSVENSYPFLRVANVPRGRLDLSEVHQIELFDGGLERYRLRYGDLLVVEGNGSSDQIGRAALWRGEIPDCVHQNHLIRVRPGPTLDPDYLELIWNSPEVSRTVQDVASSSSGLHTLSVSKLSQVPISVPAQSIQRRLVTESSDARTQLGVLRKAVVLSRSRSNSLRRSLLAEAFAGRLVRQDPEDEPACVLLDRIKSERNTGPTGRRRRAVGSRVATRIRAVLMDAESSIRVADGVPLDVAWHVEAARQPRGVIVQVHGINADMHEGGMFRRLADQLASEGFGVLRFSFRGHGLSGGSQRGATIAGEMLDLQAAVEMR